MIDIYELESAIDKLNSLVSDFEDSRMNELRVVATKARTEKRKLEAKLARLQKLQEKWSDRNA